MRADLVGPGSPSWQRLLERTPHDVYHRPEYVALCGATGGAEPLAVYATDGRDELLMPLLRQKIPDSAAVDYASPYGYSGVLTTASAPAEFVAQALGVGQDLLRESGGVSLFLRLHPLIDLPDASLERFGTLLTHGPTVSIDLEVPFEQAFAAMRSTNRNEVRRAQRAGHRAVHDVNWEHYDSFVRLYRETMRRLDAAPQYDFSEDYFERVRRDLGALTQLWHVEIGGEIAASALFFTCSDFVEYHLSASDVRFAKEQPTKLLLSSVHEAWAGRARVLHLGGGLGAREDALFFFKAGFSKRRHPYRTYRAVLNDMRYNELAARAAKRTTRDSQFFPAYRG